MVSQDLEQSVNDTDEQNSAALATVADYLTDLSTFVKDSDVTINETVSYVYTLKKKITNIWFLWLYRW